MAPRLSHGRSPAQEWLSVARPGLRRLAEEAAMPRGRKHGDYAGMLATGRRRSKGCYPGAIPLREFYFLAGFRARGFNIIRFSLGYTPRQTGRGRPGKRIMG